MAAQHVVPRILVAGRTGAGKSSLLNALLGKEAFRTGVRPTTMGFELQTWSSPWGKVEVIDSRGFAEADSAAQVASGGSVIQKGYEEAHVCLLVIPAGSRDLERESRWVAYAETAGLFKVVPVFLVVSRLDEVTPVRDWNPDSLDLKTPKTAKEINICAKLDYLKSLPSFGRFFSQDRVVPVSAGQQCAEAGFNIAPFGIRNLQDQIFKVLPDVVKIEYARILRRIELVRQSVEGLVADFVEAQVICGIICFVISIWFYGMAFCARTTSSLAHFFGFNDTAAHYASDAKWEHFVGYFFFLIVPLGLQCLMIREIANRHQFKPRDIPQLLNMFCRNPSLLRDLNWKVSASNWAWILGLYCCCSNPVGIGLFLTGPLANLCNELFYNFRVNVSKKEMENDHR